MHLDEEPVIERADDEMDVSDEEETPRKRMRDSVIEEKNNLKEENENLRCQMEAYKNEVSFIKSCCCKKDFKKIDYFTKYVCWLVVCRK